MKIPETGIAELDGYVAGVASGEIDVCKWVKLAVDRHIRDMERQGTDEFPYYFEPKACLHYVNFFQDILRHFDGIHSGKAIMLEPWQYFVWGSPFGWLKVDRLEGHPIRRFREAFIMTPKKQGKTICIAGSSLYMVDWDGWPGAQIYFLALDQTQAKKLGYGDAVKLVNKSPELEGRLRVNKSAGDMGIYCDEMDSSIRPSISDEDKTDGLKVQMSANDEVKDWTNFGIYQTMKQNTAANPNSLILNTTTAGSDMSSLGYDLEDKLKKVLSQSITDEQFFGIIYAGDKEDREFIEEHINDKDAFEKIKPLIQKANPNYGVSVGEDYYRGRISDAQKSSRDLNEFLTKHMNFWINAMDHYYNMEEWGRCKNEKYADWKKEFAGKPCYVFIDLQAKKDICPMYALFPDGETESGKRKYAVFGVNFLPGAVVSKNLVGKKASYNEWATDGFFTLTPGKTTDYDYVLEELKQWKQLFNIKAVGFDDWGPQVFAQKIEASGMKVYIIKQSTKYLSDPMKTIDAWTVDHRIAHNGDPVLFWAMGNVVAKEDANENVFPRKEHPDNKIDPAVALINLVAMELEDPLPKSGQRRVPKVWSV
ncbi:MAG: hypothetical protein CL666_04725 [Balneola sp.]|nr:hypothetical protein [Balneola sp.]|tara:strand:+ start:48417 stop:50195 length:1779 start_codon:yes stop_codon:yes gene_type:complete